MKTMKTDRTLRPVLLALCLLLTAACKPRPETRLHAGFERSYWVDIDLRQNNGRGYWKPVGSLPPDTAPTQEAVRNAVRELAHRYGGDKIYVVYHRQFEPAQAKELLLAWKEAARRQGVEVVPAVVLEDYAAPSSLNFTEAELTAFARWCIETIHPTEFGIYDVYVRQAAGSLQDGQLAALRAAIGDRLVRLGQQPGEPVNAHYASAVEDTWTAECQGLTNELWKNPVRVNGTDLYGRKLLESWVRERLDDRSRRIVWDMIPVAWDYDAPPDAYGYVCPGDDARTNDPPLAGRIRLCHRSIAGMYPGGTLNPAFGGYSCDLHILDANSAGRPERPTFYDCLRAGKPYTGNFGSALEQIADLYKSLGAPHPGTSNPHAE